MTKYNAGDWVNELMNILNFLTATLPWAAYDQVSDFAWLCCGSGCIQVDILELLGAPIEV